MGGGVIVHVYVKIKSLPDLLSQGSLEVKQYLHEFSLIDFLRITKGYMKYVFSYDVITNNRSINT